MPSRSAGRDGGRARDPGPGRHLPVGEEWLHQAWSASYRPLMAMLDRLAGEGRRGLLTLGLTPVLAAMLDDPYCLAELHTWLGFWQVRAEELAGRPQRHLRELAAAEFAAAGFRPARVTSIRTPPSDKTPYDPVAAAGAVRQLDARLLRKPDSVGGLS